MGHRKPVILSASRRTDLPGWHADTLAARLEEQLAQRGPDGIYGVVFWTRFPAALLEPPLRGIIEGLEVRDLVDGGRGPAAVVNLTVTGQGGRRIEPCAPPTDDVLDALPELVDLLGAAERIRWRYDPVIPGRASAEQFAELGAVFAGLGVPTCTFSYPAQRSLRGSMEPLYRHHEIPRWTDEESRRSFSRELAAVAAELNIQLLACNQPEVLEHHPCIGQAQCIPLDVLARAHPDGAAAPTGKDKSQRQHCTCPPSVELGNYRTDACGSGCLYCYSTLGGPDAGQQLPYFLRGK